MTERERGRERGREWEREREREGEREGDGAGKGRERVRKREEEARVKEGKDSQVTDDRLTKLSCMKRQRPNPRFQSTTFQHGPCKAKISVKCMS